MSATTKIRHTLRTTRTITARVLLAAFVLFLSAIPTSHTYAETALQAALHPWYSTVLNYACTTSGSSTDYAGNPILTAAQSQAITEYEPIYEQAAQQVGIPWQMLAAIHYRETDLREANPANGNGIYQVLGTTETPGPVSDADFLTQSIAAAQLLKQKATENYPGDQNLTPQANAATIKDTFFSYNGRAQAYLQQATSLGYTSTQGYEGSPYVMNKADAQRDPDKDPTGWGQIDDKGNLVYPADEAYGAFVVYSALTGTSSGGCQGTGVNCTGSSGATASSSLRQNVVCIATQELKLWQNGTLKPNTFAYKKYTGGPNTPWCAYFANWVYSQAGDPLNSVGWPSGASVGWVPDITVYDGLQSNSKFTYHAVSSGYAPQPGDLAIHSLSQPNLSYGAGSSQNGLHISIVVSTQGATVTTIAGDIETSSNSSYQANIVEQIQNIPSRFDPPIVGYISPNQ